MPEEALKEVFARALRRLLCELDRDPHSRERGCFDRRFWSWKLVDFPEASFQRNALPLVELASVLGLDGAERRIVESAAKDALLRAARLQHSDGSFDQAFPNERSFGATAFILDSLCGAFAKLGGSFSATEEAAASKLLLKAVAFLERRDETHGLISNHLAGAASALLKASKLFPEAAGEAERTARKLLDRILDAQSREGWFVEYEGADPGYQTLCVHYLAQCYKIAPDARLRDALARSFEFLKFFVHPDGSFGGEYGSRRTSVFYPGGFACLADEFPVAASIWRRMRSSLEAESSVTPDRVDMGNLAPLLSSWLLAAPRWSSAAPGAEEPLPCELENASADFNEAGLHVRSRGGRYLVCGVSNGGVIKLFDRASGRKLLDDCGYAGGLRDGRKISVQITTKGFRREISGCSFDFDAPFFIMPQATPTPLKFLALRVLNLTAMRSIFLGNLIKGALVKLLISGKRSVPLLLRRHVELSASGALEIKDVLRLSGPLDLVWLATGGRFCAIHMASSRYFENFAPAETEASELDVAKLLAEGELRREARL